MFSERVKLVVQSRSVKRDKYSFWISLKATQALNGWHRICFNEFTVQDDIKKLYISSTLILRIVFHSLKATSQKYFLVNPTL